MLIINRLIGFGAGTKTKLDPGLYYIDGRTDPSNATTYDFGNFYVSDAGLLIVATQGRTGSEGVTVSSVTVGGNAATIHVNPSASGSQTSGAIAARVVSGGSHNVTVTFTGSRQKAACFVWLLVGYTSATPHDTTGNNAAQGRTQTTSTLDIPANGVAVYAAVHENTNDTTWSGATELADLTVETARFSAASKTTVTALSSDSVTASWSGSAGFGRVAASWALTS